MNLVEALIANETQKIIVCNGNGQFLWTFEVGEMIKSSHQLNDLNKYEFVIIKMPLKKEFECKIYQSENFYLHPGGDGVYDNLIPFLNKKVKIIIEEIL